MIATQSGRFAHRSPPSVAREVAFRGVPALAAFLLCALTSACATSPGTPAGEPVSIESEVSGADAAELSADAAAIAIPCNHAVGPNSLRFDGATGEWIAEMRIRDDVVRNQIGAYDGLEQPYLRMLVNGRSEKVALEYRETVMENEKAVDVFQKSWSLPPTATVGEDVDYFIAIHGRPARYLCGRGVVSGP